MQIDYYLSPVSPFTYLCGTRPAEIAARHGATLRYRPVDPVALFSRTGGLPPKDRHPNRQAYRLQELRREAARLGMPIDLHPAHWPTNPAPASYAIIAAQADGSGDMGALVAALTRACWAEGRDVAEDDTIAACLTAAGFEPALATRGMLAGAESYGRNLEEAVASGAFGVPTFIVGQEVFWGQDRLGALDAFLG